jgi:hypothetical protein
MTLMRYECVLTMGAQIFPISLSEISWLHFAIPLSSAEALGQHKENPGYEVVVGYDYD